MKKFTWLMMFLFLISASLTLFASAPITKASKIIELGDEMLHPDGMTVNPKTGDIILAVPVIGDKGNAWLLKIDANDNVSNYFELPAHPETGRVTPLGICFGPDGHLYIADAQTLGGNSNHKGRILRVVHQNGKPVRSEVLITGIVQPNGIDIHKNKLYIAETQIDPAIVGPPMVSGIFCYDLSELGRNTILRAAPYGKDPHFIFKFDTSDKKHDGKWMVGANGIGLSQSGKIYVANFGDQKIIEVVLDKSGKKAVSHRDCNENGPMESVDGLKVCPKGYVFFADYVGNAVCVMNPKNGKTIVLAKNDVNPNEEAKKNGALDRCSEVCIRGGKLYVSNIDLDDCSKPHCISVIDLSGIDFDELLK
ncbi:MAG: hypothetical protein ACRCUY_06055 [Thermoguttaceae bacterium]